MVRVESAACAVAVSEVEIGILIPEVLRPLSKDTSSSGSRLKDRLPRSVEAILTDPRILRINAKAVNH